MFEKIESNFTREERLLFCILEELRKLNHAEVKEVTTEKVNVIDNKKRPKKDGV
jgi:hypothetical protein